MLFSRQDFELFQALLGRDLKAKYKSTVIGYFWSLILPLAQTMIFFTVFSIFLRFQITDYFLFLSIGFMIWQFFSNTLQQCATIFLVNGYLLKKTRAPRIIFIWASAGSELVHLLVSLPVLLGIMLCCGRVPHLLPLLLLPLTLLTTVMFSVGIGLFIAILNVYFRDLERILQIILQIWFYGTPVFYSIQQIPEKYHSILQINPMFFYIALWRDVFYEPACPLWYYLVALLWGAAIFAAGYIFFRHKQKNLAEVV